VSAPELLAFAIIAAGLGTLSIRLDQYRGTGLLGAFLLSAAFWLILAAAAVAGS
jgi:hypothetical protein